MVAAHAAAAFASMFGVSELSDGNEDKWECSLELYSWSAFYKVDELYVWVGVDAEVGTLDTVH